MKWVTWEHVGMDRIGCAWLIRKHIDPKFLFVPKGQQPLPPGAEPFNIPGVRLSHHEGHCSFFAMLKEYKSRTLYSIKLCASSTKPTLCKKYKSSRWHRALTLFMKASA
jgi:hypothetical protein